MSRDRREKEKEQVKGSLFLYYLHCSWLCVWHAIYRCAVKLCNASDGSLNFVCSCFWCTGLVWDLTVVCGCWPQWGSVLNVIGLWLLNMVYAIKAGSNSWIRFKGQFCFLLVLIFTPSTSCKWDECFPLSLARARSFVLRQGSLIGQVYLDLSLTLVPRQTWNLQSSPPTLQKRWL